MEKQTSKINIGSLFNFKIESIIIATSGYFLSLSFIVTLGFFNQSFFSLIESPLRYFLIALQILAIFGYILNLVWLSHYIDNYNKIKNIKRINKWLNLVLIFIFPFLELYILLQKNSKLTKSIFGKGYVLVWVIWFIVALLNFFATIFLIWYAGTNCLLLTFGSLFSSSIFSLPPFLAQLSYTLRIVGVIILLSSSVFRGLLYYQISKQVQIAERNPE